MSLKIKEFSVWLFFIITSSLCAIWLFLYDHSADNYSYITFLPTVFTICNIIFVVIYKKLLKNVGLTLLHCLMYIRFVVTPFLMTQAGYISVYNRISESNINRAIILMSYECVAIYIVLAFSVMHSCRKDATHNFSYNENILNVSRPDFLFRSILAVMVVYCVVVWISVPTCRDMYKTVFEFSDVDFTSADYDASNESVGSLARSLQTLFKVFFDIIRLVVPMNVLIALKRKGCNPICSIVIGLLFALVQLFFITQTTARAIICTFLIIYFISKLYPKYSKIIIQTSVLLSTLVIICYFAIRFTIGSRYGDELSEYLSKVFSAYFGGLDNVAAGGNLPEGHEASTFFASLYSAIPFNSTLFGLKVEKLQSIFNTVNGSYGQIPPMVVESSYYFGEILAPVISCICAFFAYHFGERFSKTDSSWHLVSNLFLAIICAISIVMYNEEILLVWLLEWLVPMKILSRLADRERRSEQ